MSVTASPLQWPSGWQRATQKAYSKFGNYTFEQMRVEVLRQLRLLEAKNVIISSDLRLRQDGFPFSGQRQPEDVGIAVYFDLNGDTKCIPCDKWSTVEDNLRAIALTVEALRGIDRWGAKEMVNAAFRGFKALPESAIVTPYSKRAWYEVLEVAQTASPEIIRAAYRQKAMKAHPDQGGTPAAFEEVQSAYRESGASI